MNRIGYIPGIGKISSSTNAGIHAVRGNRKQADWAAAGALPGRQFVKGIKASSNVLKQVLRGSKQIQRMKWKSGKKGWNQVEIRAKTGQSYRNALKDFYRLVDESTIRRFKSKNGKTGFMGRMRNGYEVKVRSWSSDGRPTLEINRKTPSGGLKKLEMRYGSQAQGNNRRRG